MSTISLKNQSVKQSKLSVDDLSASDSVMASALSQMAEENLFLWLDSRAGEVHIDHHLIEFYEKHRCLIDLYCLIDVNLRKTEVVLRKAAQRGGTVWEILGCLFLASRMQPVKIGFYFPTSSDLDKMVKDRWNPLIVEMPEFSLRDDPKSRDSNLQQKFIGKSTIYLNSVKGTVGMDSTPMDIIFIDEQRLMDNKEVERLSVRLDASSIKLIFKASTPNYPDENIDEAFKQGTQHRWHIKCACKCPECGNPGMCLEDYWPHCVEEHDQQAYLKCPQCGMYIEDGQNGAYYPHNLGAPYPSYGFSQLPSCGYKEEGAMTELWVQWKRATDKQNFYNQKLGLPYIDEANRPITLRIINECTDLDLKWYSNMNAMERQAAVRDTTVMGVDHMSGNAYVVVVRLTKDGPTLLHLEIIEEDNPKYFVKNEKSGELEKTSPFNRMHEIMKEFNIDFALIDGNPNPNESKNFARKYLAKVFIAFYTSDPKNNEAVQWQDRARHKIATRKSNEQKFKYKAIINQYVCVDFMFQKWVDNVVITPQLDDIFQVARDAEGRMVNHCIGATFKKHLMGLVRERKEQGEAGTYRMHWKKIGGDPHFTFATAFAMTAADRASITGSSMLI